MASKAGWQTTEFGGTDRFGEVWQSSRRGGHLTDDPLDKYLDNGSGGPMDQRTVEDLLRRLVDRVEESERRYGEALNELHTRLDRLSQTTEAARSTSAPEDADTFDRLHAQVSDLARRLESDTRTPLDDFERLGRAVTGGIRGDLDNEPAGAPRYEPEPSPFAQSVMASQSYGQHALDLDIPAEPAWTPPAVQPDFDNRLAEMANRLEQSIGAAMPSSTIEALNARIEEIGNQIAKSLEQAPSRSSLEHVEQQIAEMGQQLNRAEEQLGRLGGVEERLLALLARLEDKDADPKPAEIDAAQLQEIAAKAAVEAARLVADNSQKTTDRLEAMQRELNAVGDFSRQSDDKLSSTLQSVHESLKQLVQQVERPEARSPQANPFAAKPAPQRPSPAAPAPAATAPEAPAPKSWSEPEPMDQGSAASSAKPHAPEPSPRRSPAQPSAPAPRTTATSAQAPHPERPRFPEVSSSTAMPQAEHSSADDAERRLKETLRDRLNAGSSKVKPRNLLAAFERARTPRVEEAEPVSGMEPAADLDAPATQDMVAAARRAAQAAAAHAEARKEIPSRRKPVLSAPQEEPASGRRRPYLIISVAILLAISAFLLYGRLTSKTASVADPSPVSESFEPADGTAGPTAPGTNAPADAATAPGEKQSGSFPSVPGMMTLPEQVGQAGSGVTDIPKTSTHPMPANELKPAPQLASLKSNDAPALPGGVIFSIEEPGTASEAATAEALTATSVKGPMPSEAIGPETLRMAAAKGDPIAQYTVAIRYIDGQGVSADPETGAEWLERAARAGLAPAQYRLGTMYERGVGVTANIDTARSWYLAAAERGNVKAMHNLAVSVSGRAGSTPNYVLAAKWYQEAALRGLADSQFNLGILAEHGLGRSKDLAEAYKWYSLAAAQGDSEAQKRRSSVSSQLTSEMIVAIDEKVVNWKPKAVSPEANDVAEPTAWGAAPASASNQTPESTTLVSRAQTLLNKLGYDVGVPDGLAGNKTLAGVKRFQQRNGLAETGEITVELVSRLEALAG